MTHAVPAEETVPPEVEHWNSRFCRLFEVYQPALRRLVSAYLGNPADREDLLQEIAAGIWKSLPGFRGDSGERTWIYRIAHNIAIRYSYRNRKRSAREPSIDAALDSRSWDATAENALLVDERRRLLMSGIRDLPVLDRQVVTLHLEGLRAFEIEEITGISEAAVATRLTRIRQKLAIRVQAESPRS